MAPRFPFDESPDPEAREVIEQALEKMHSGVPPFKFTEDDNKTLVGCYAPMCYSPIITRQFFALAKACYDPTAVKPKIRELAILGFASIMHVPYIVYCHRGCAEQVGLTSEQYAAGLTGETPSGLSEPEAMAYQLARILTQLTSRLDDNTWNAATEKLEKAEVVGITHIVAGYRWVALLAQLNGDDNRWE
ncbi:AhpD-like protein [Xylaria arbuscula]|nr:AhpD-like protein [Xylaria arbuscula]